MYFQPKWRRQKFLALQVSMLYSCLQVEPVLFVHVNKHAWSRILNSYFRRHLVMKSLSYRNWQKTSLIVFCRAARCGLLQRVLIYILVVWKTKRIGLFFVLIFVFLQPVSLTSPPDNSVAVYSPDKYYFLSKGSMFVWPPSELLVNPSVFCTALFINVQKKIATSN